MLPGRTVSDLCEIRNLWGPTTFQSSGSHSPAGGFTCLPPISCSFSSPFVWGPSHCLARALPTVPEPFKLEVQRVNTDEPAKGLCLRAHQTASTPATPLDTRSTHGPHPVSPRHITIETARFLGVPMSLRFLLLVLLSLGLTAPGCPTVVDDDDSAGDDDDATGDDDDATGDDDDATGDDDDSAGDDDDSAGDDPTDGDNDGVDSSSDCDDGDPNVYPGADETCDDAIDNDCDATTDCQGACATSVSYTNPCGTTGTYAGPAPLLHWDFEDPGALFVDASGNSNDGTGSGGWSSQSPGWIGTSAELSLASADVEIGDLTSWTSAQWVNLNALPTEDFAMLAGNRNGSAQYTGWAVVVNGAGFAGAYVEGGNANLETILIGTSPVCTNGWTHIAATWELGQLSVYVDGVLSASTMAPFTAITPGDLPYTIGWDPNQARRYLDGSLDDVALWDSALSTSDLAALVADGYCGNGL